MFALLTELPDMQAVDVSIEADVSIRLVLSISSFARFFAEKFSILAILLESLN